MPLHFQAQEVVAKINAARSTPVWQMDMCDYRKMINANAEVMAGKPIPVAQVENKDIAGPNGSIAVRLYTPQKITAEGLVIYFPGSGFVNGALASQDNACRQIANLTECKVMQVSYRSAPEFKFPVGLHDVFAAIVWANEHATELNIDSNKIALAGCSSGANFAALCALRARDEHLPICAVVLNMPLTDLACDYPSYQKFAAGYVLESQACEYFVELYLPPNIKRTDPAVSPYYVADLTNLPPMLIQTAEYDPLADDGAKFAARLKAAGNQVKHTCYQGQIHTLLAWCGGALNQAANPCVEIAEFLQARMR